MFKIQAYVKQRLGQLYFPGIDAAQARRKLLYQIDIRPLLKSALSSRERNPKAKKFTAEEVSLIVAMLGEPPYREETLSYPP